MKQTKSILKQLQILRIFDGKDSQPCRDVKAIIENLGSSEEDFESESKSDGWPYKNSMHKKNLDEVEGDLKASMRYKLKH